MKWGDNFPNFTPAVPSITVLAHTEWGGQRHQTRLACNITVHTQPQLSSPCGLICSSHELKQPLQMFVFSKLSDPWITPTHLNFNFAMGKRERNLLLQHLCGGFGGWGFPFFLKFWNSVLWLCHFAESQWVLDRLWKVKKAIDIFQDSPGWPPAPDPSQAYPGQGPSDCMCDLWGHIC